MGDSQWGNKHINKLLDIRTDKSIFYLTVFTYEKGGSAFPAGKHKELISALTRAYKASGGKESEMAVFRDNVSLIIRAEGEFNKKNNSAALSSLNSARDNAERMKLLLNQFYISSLTSNVYKGGNVSLYRANLEQSTACIEKLGYEDDAGDFNHDLAEQYYKDKRYNDALARYEKSSSFYSSSGLFEKAVDNLVYAQQLQIFLGKKEL
jgi:tetratricopeptide (TPR) repeat protein